MRNVLAASLILLGCVTFYGGFHTYSLGVFQCVGVLLAVAGFILIRRRDDPSGPEQQKEYGVISVDADTLRYVVHGKLLWEVPLDSVRVIGEFTTDAGPWFDDHFLVFVVGHPLRFLEVPVEAASSAAVLKPLAARLGSSITYGLANRTDFVSRVMWPPHLTGQDLFQFQREPRSGALWGRAKDAVLPIISHSLTAEVAHYVEDETEQKAALDAHKDARQ